MRTSAAPIFIVGSPRSGTSILTWCFGQHPNILPIEESNWIGELAYYLSVCHAIGSARGEHSHLGSMGITFDALSEAVGEAVNRLTVQGRIERERNYAAFLSNDPTAAQRAFPVALHRDDPKSRWVDGTPEYSLYIWGLRKLFPAARFIHLVRDVKEVVRSLLHFATTGGSALVNSEQAAYECWLRRVRACLEAERALGSDIVLRVRYADLTAAPEPLFRRCLAFLGEEFSADCLEPLRQRINNSKVPPDYDPFDEKTDPAVRAEAEELSARILSEPEPSYRPDREYESRMEQSFLSRAQCLADLVAAASRGEGPAPATAPGDSGAEKPLQFRCNICGTACVAPWEDIDREIPSCKKCGSTVRFRSVIDVLSRELFGTSIALPDFPVRRDIVGIGMSDWGGYAVPLAEKLGYRNTFYHTDPLLDITCPPPEWEATLDFVICSEVFEHIPPPVDKAFVNLRRLLKPGGVVIFTVPWAEQGETVEHFPDLHDYRIDTVDGRFRLVNTTRRGEVQVFENLVFHGGPGTTLEMRQFSKPSLLAQFRDAGFSNVRVCDEANPGFGIFWKETWSLPMSARAPS